MLERPGRKCPEESESAGEKRARLDRRNEKDRARRKNETEEKRREQREQHPLIRELLNLSIKGLTNSSVLPIKRAARLEQLTAASGCKVT